MRLTAAQDLVLLWMKLCANPPLHLHTDLSQQTPRMLPHFFLVLHFKDEPKVLVSSFFQCQTKVLRKLTVRYPLLLLNFVTVVWWQREHWGQHHCSPASWLLEIFCTRSCTHSRKTKTNKICHIDFNICLLSCLLTVEMSKNRDGLHSEVEAILLFFFLPHF